MAPDWSKLKDVILQHESFLITTHVRPDADALGSELGLAAILKAFDREVHIINATAPPSNLHFLNPEGVIRKLDADSRKAELPKTDVQVIVDTSAWHQLGAMAEVVQRRGGRRVVIDHHVSSSDLGALEFKDVTSPATGELIYNAARALGVEFDAATASAVYAAIATDTGWFRFPSTGADTMRVGGALIDWGAEPDRLYHLLYEQNSHARIRLGARVMERTIVECDGRLAWIQTTAKDFSDTGAVPSDTESLVNQCLTISGTEAAFIAVQLPSGVNKFSLRCREPHDVAELAEQFGGGGHKLASGATVSGDFDKAVDSVRRAFCSMLDSAHNV